MELLPYLERIAIADQQDRRDALLAWSLNFGRYPEFIHPIQSCGIV